jgi:hypothetical protein
VSDNPFADRRDIDRRIDIRKEIRPNDYSPIVTPLTPQELHAALQRPAPPEGQGYPLKVLYRGLYILAKG